MLREEIWGLKVGILKSSNMGHCHGESNWFWVPQFSENCLLQILLRDIFSHPPFISNSPIVWSQICVSLPWNSGVLNMNGTVATESNSYISPRSRRLEEAEQIKRVLPTKCLSCFCHLKQIGQWQETDPVCKRKNQSVAKKHDDIHNTSN